MWSIAKSSKRLRGQMKAQGFDLVDPVPIPSFPSAFQYAFDTNYVHKDESILFLQFCIKHLAPAALDTHMQGKSEVRKHRKFGTAT